MPGNYMQTYTGKRFFPRDPDPSQICIEDIAHHLSNLCRYNGAAKNFYSVAEHSIIVSHYVDPQYALVGLLHDAAEAYAGDIIRPLKHHETMAAYRAIEERILACVFAALDVPFFAGMVWELTHDVDNRIVIDESEVLLEHPDEYVTDPPLEPLGCEILCYSPKLAEVQFLLRYAELRCELS